jgi:Glycosyltransferase family 87
MTGRRRLALVGAVYGAALLGLGQLVLGIQAFLSDPLDQDFTLWYAAAKIGLSDGWSHLYDLDRQQQVIRQLQHVTGVLSPLSVYISPPPLAWLVAPFTLLPPVPAFLAWTAISIAALAAAWWLAAPEGGRRWLYALPLVAWFPVFISLVLGQPVAIVVLCLALAVWLARRKRSFAAGAVLALALLKPQVALLVGPALLAGGELAFGLGWLTGTAVLVALSVVVVGLPGLERGLQLLRGVQVYPYNSWLTLGYLVNPVVRSGYLSANARVAPFDPLTLGLDAAVGVAALAVAFRNRGRLGAVVAAGIIGTILAAPHLHQDDLAVLVVAAWLLAAENPGKILRAWPLVVLLAGELPQLITPVPLEISLLVWLLLLWRHPDRPPRSRLTALHEVPAVAL